MTKKQPKIKKPVYKETASLDVKYNSFTLTEFISWIKEHVPEGTKNEDILLDFEVDQTWGYYDDVVISAEMKLKVKS